VLGAGLVVIVILAPFLALSWGFALSVVATGALILAVPPLYGWLKPRLQLRLRNERVAMLLAAAITVTIVAQAATAPILLLMDANVRLIAVPANLLAMPVVPIVTIGGLLAALVGPIQPHFAALVAEATSIPGSWIAGVAGWAATTRSPEISSLTGFGAVVVIVVMIVAILRRVRWYYLLPSVIIAGIMWWFPTRSIHLPNWSMVMCDVGQGDGLVLRDPQGPVVLVDVGAREAGMDVCLDELGVDSIDVVVLTHFHADHVGGLARVLDTRDVGAIRTTPVQDPADRAALAAVDAESHGLSIEILWAGDSLTFGGSRLDVISPAYEIPGGSRANNASVVLLGDVAGIGILLTGDIEPEAQEAVMARVPVIDVVVAKVPHHGSGYQHPEFPRWARAEVALVSVGVDNDYGHPDEEALDAWRATGAVVLRTDLQGAVALAREGDELRIQTARSDMLEPP
jgi:competence protein ComEC